MVKLDLKDVVLVCNRRDMPSTCKTTQLKIVFGQQTFSSIWLPVAPTPNASLRINWTDSFTADVIGDSPALQVKMEVWGNGKLMLRPKLLMRGSAHLNLQQRSNKGECVIQLLSSGSFAKKVSELEECQVAFNWEVEVTTPQHTIKQIPRLPIKGGTSASKLEQVSSFIAAGMVDEDSEQEADSDSMVSSGVSFPPQHHAHRREAIIRVSKDLDDDESQVIMTNTRSEEDDDTHSVVAPFDVDDMTDWLSNSNNNSASAHSLLDHHQVLPKKSVGGIANVVDDTNDSEEEEEVKEMSPQALSFYRNVMAHSSESSASASASDLNYSADEFMQQEQQLQQKNTFLMNSLMDSSSGDDEKQPAVVSFRQAIVASSEPPVVVLSAATVEVIPVVTEQTEVKDELDIFPDRSTSLGSLDSASKIGSRISSSSSPINPLLAKGSNFGFRNPLGMRRSPTKKADSNHDPVTPQRVADAPTIVKSPFPVKIETYAVNVEETRQLDIEAEVKQEKVTIYASLPMPPAEDLAPAPLPVPVVPSASVLEYAVEQQIVNESVVAVELEDQTRNVNPIRAQQRRSQRRSGVTTAEVASYATDILQTADALPVVEDTLPAVQIAQESIIDTTLDQTKNEATKVEIEQSKPAGKSPADRKPQRRSQRRSGIILGEEVDLAMLLSGNASTAVDENSATKVDSVVQENMIEDKPPLSKAEVQEEVVTATSVSVTEEEPLLDAIIVSNTAAAKRGSQRRPTRRSGITTQEVVDLSLLLKEGNTNIEEEQPTKPLLSAKASQRVRFSVYDDESVDTTVFEDEASVVEAADKAPASAPSNPFYAAADDFDDDNNSHNSQKPATVPSVGTGSQDDDEDDKATINRLKDEIHLVRDHLQAEVEHKTNELKLLHASFELHRGQSSTNVSNKDYEQKLQSKDNEVKDLSKKITSLSHDNTLLIQEVQTQRKLVEQTGHKFNSKFDALQQQMQTIIQTNQDLQVKLTNNEKIILKKDQEISELRKVNYHRESDIARIQSQVTDLSQQLTSIAQENIALKDSLAAIPADQLVQAAHLHAMQEEERQQEEGIGGIGTIHERVNEMIKRRGSAMPYLPTNSKLQINRSQEDVGLTLFTDESNDDLPPRVPIPHTATASINGLFHADVTRTNANTMMSINSPSFKPFQSHQQQHALEPFSPAAAGGIMMSDFNMRDDTSTLGSRSTTLTPNSTSKLTRKPSSLERKKSRASLTDVAMSPGPDQSVMDTIAQLTSNIKRKMTKDSLLLSDLVLGSNSEAAIEQAAAQELLREPSLSEMDKLLQRQAAHIEERKGVPDLDDIPADDVVVPPVEEDVQLDKSFVTHQQALSAPPLVQPMQSPRASQSQAQLQAMKVMRSPTARQHAITPRSPHNLGEAFRDTLTNQADMLMLSTDDNLDSIRNMLYFYENLLMTLGDGIRAGVLRIFRIMELTISRSTLQEVSPHKKRNSSTSPNPMSMSGSNTPNVGTNRKLFNSSAPMTMTDLRIDLNRSPSDETISSYHSHVGGGDHRLKSGTVAVQSGAVSLMPPYDFHDTQSLLEIISQRNSNDPQLKNNALVMLSHTLHLNNIEELLVHVRTLLEASYRLLGHDQDLLSGRLWDISALFNSAKVLIYLFGTETAHGRGSITANHVGAMVAIEGEHVLVSDAAVAYTAIKGLKEELNQLLLTQQSLFPQQQIANNNQGSGLSVIFDSSSSTLKTPRGSLATINNQTVRHKSVKASATLPELLAESEAIRAQMVANLLPHNMALIEVMVKLVAYRESLVAQSGYYKSIGKKDTYKFLKKLSKAVEVQLELDLSTHVYAASSHMQPLASKIVGAIEDLDRVEGKDKNNREAIVEKMIHSAGRFMLDRLRELVINAEDLFTRMRMYLDTLASFRQDMNSDSEDENTNTNNLRAAYSNNDADTLRYGSDGDQLERALNEIATSKEELKRKVILLSNAINEDVEMLIKTNTSEDVLAIKLFDASFRRDDSSIAVLLLRSKSSLVLHSIYSTWPGLTFRIAETQQQQNNQPQFASLAALASSNNKTAVVNNNLSMSPAMTRTSGSSYNLMSSQLQTPFSPPTLAAAGNGKSGKKGSINGSGLLSPSPMTRNAALASSSTSRSNDMNMIDMRATESPNTTRRDLFGSRSSSPTKQQSQQAITDIYHAIAAKDMNTHSVDFRDTRALRHLGFSLIQLRDSKCYTWTDLLNAGYPLRELKPLRAAAASSSHHGHHHHDDRQMGFKLSVDELRHAGYSIEQCLKAGFDASALKAGGFDELQLVQSGLFNMLQLKRAGCDIQRFALKALYDMTDGPHWRRKENWCSSRPLSEWYGIKLDGGGHVIRIDLRSNELHGQLPEALYLLSHLQSLDLYNNKLRGEIPVEYSKLTSLKDLWLDENGFRQGLRKSQLQSLLPSCRIRL